MTDRELLERAAKAACLEPFAAWGKAFVMGEGSPPKPEWNPLTDDGDALRLAVKLRLVIQHAPKYVVVMDHSREIAEHQDTRENDGDPYAATRRAIVRAAAEIAQGASGSPLRSGARQSEQDAPCSSIGLGAEGEQ